jgi:hypothetical protein
MTLVDYEELCAYWAEHPPVHLMVAAYLGVGEDKPQAVRPAAAPPSQVNTLPLMGVHHVRDYYHGLGAPILDFEELKKQAQAG